MARLFQYANYLKAPPLWLVLAMLGVGNLSLRYWQLGTPAFAVFDEVYYVPFADHILQGNDFFDAHPPLGKYWIAFSFALFTAWRSFWDSFPQGGLDVSPLLGYRWLNATVGAGVPLLGAWVAWEWSRAYSLARRRWFAALSAILMSMDGLLFAESRLALLHVSLVSFGLVGLAAWGRSQASPHPRWWQLLSGLALGASINVKWNGAGYLLTLACLAGFRLFKSSRPVMMVGVGRCLLWLGLVPLGSYALGWIPYLRLTGDGFWQLHQRLWQFHIHISATHPYQSVWYTWPLMIRPIGYFYRGLAAQETLSLGPPSPSAVRAIAIYGMNNPFLHWLATAAIIVLLIQGIQIWMKRKPSRESFSIPLVIITAYFCNWLPWSLIGRSTFFYHYLSAGLMAEMGLAWLMSGWLLSDRTSWRWLSWLVLGFIFAGFLFWLPLWTGWVIPVEELGKRWWMPSWR